MPSRPAVRADDKRLAVPGQKKRVVDKHGNGQRNRFELYDLGLLKVEDMDDKELAKGKWRDKDGKFRGRPTKNLPRKFADELDAERVKRWNNKVRSELDASLETLKQLRDNPRASADARMKSAMYLIERTVGKVPEKSEVKLEVAVWQQDIEGILVGDDDSTNELEG